MSWDLTLEPRDGGTFGSPTEVLARVRAVLPDATVTEEDPAGWTAEAAAAQQEDPGDHARNDFLAGLASFMAGLAARMRCGRVESADYGFEFRLHLSNDAVGAIGVSVRGDGGALPAIRVLADALNAGATENGPGKPVDLSAGPVPGFERWRAVRDTVVNGRPDNGAGAI